MKRVLGIDFGQERIGIAVSDPLNIIARGLSVVRNTPRAPDEIRRIAEEYDVDIIVVGMPLQLDGRKGRSAEEVDKFMEAVRQATGREIVPWDERFSSVQAHETMRMMGVPKLRRRSKPAVDQMAAAIILQGYLDRQQARA